LKKAVPFKPQTDDFYQRALDKFDAGDFLGSLELLRHAHSQIKQRYSNDDLAIRFEIAETLSYMDLFEESNRELFKLTAFDYALDEVFYGLVKNYAMMEMPEQAAYYLDYAIENEILMPEDGFESLDFEFGAAPEIERLRLVKPEEHTQTLYAARQLMGARDLVIAKQLLLGVPDTSPQFSSVSNYLALIEASEGNNQKALEHCEDALKVDPLDVCALTTRILALDMEGESAKAYKEITELDLLGITDFPDIAKIAICSCQIGNVDIAYKYLKMCIPHAPYDKELMVLFILAAANAGHFREAKDMAVALRTVYPIDSVIEYYARQVDLLDGRNGNFTLVPELPKEERRNHLLALENYFAKKATAPLGIKIMHDESLRRAVTWGLYCSDLELSSRIAGQLASVKTPYYHMARELLLDPDFSIVPKKEIFLTLLKNEDGKTIQMVVAHQLHWYKPTIPKVTKNAAIKDAYYNVYSALAFVSTDFDRKLNTWYKKLVEGLRGYSGEISPRAFAALLAFKSRATKIFSKIPYTCEIFNCPQEEFMPLYTHYEKWAKTSSVKKTVVQKK